MSVPAGHSPWHAANPSIPRPRSRSGARSRPPRPWADRWLEPSRPPTASGCPWWEPSRPRTAVECPRPTEGDDQWAGRSRLRTAVGCLRPTGAAGLRSDRSLPSTARGCPWWVQSRPPTVGVRRPSAPSPLRNRSPAPFPGSTHRTLRRVRGRTASSWRSGGDGRAASLRVSASWFCRADGGRGRVVEEPDRTGWGRAYERWSAPGPPPYGRGRDAGLPFRPAGD